MSKQTEALKMAQAALAASDDFLFNYHDCEPNNEREVDAYSEIRANNMAAWEAVREALAEQPAQQQCMEHGECFGGECIYPAQQPAQQQEPVFWYRPVGDDGGYEGPIHNSAIEKVRKMAGTWKPLYTSPPASKPLTDEEIDKLPWEPHEGNPMTFAEGLRYFARAIEAAHGITGEQHG